MNICDAIKSGKPFKLPHHNSYFTPDKYLNHPLFSKEEAASEDWGLEEERRDLSWSEIYDAFGAAIVSYKGTYPECTYNQITPLSIVKSSLGFKE